MFLARAGRLVLLVLFSATLLTHVSFAFADGDVTQRGQFPKGPEPTVTPGSLCDQPDDHRYPENIAYCKRNVTGDFKDQLIQMYDSQFGYAIGTMPREEFKIDHFIPLCAGGSNRGDNLWPQHKTVYEITDPVEPLICQRMAEGKLMQADAVTLVRKAKFDLSKVNDVLNYLNSL
jgi:hypothetical protein